MDTNISKVEEMNTLRTQIISTEITINKLKKHERTGYIGISMKISSYYRYLKGLKERLNLLESEKEQLK